MKIKGLRQSNKGFTLVELCVTMVLFSVLATITTLSLLSWQENSTYKTQEDNAELIYMAARNKIAQLKANNTLDEFDGWADSISGNRVGSNVTYQDTSKKKLVNEIYYALCCKGDYQDYNSGNSIDKRKALVFELINDYISDKGLLNGNIVIEYGKDGTIYAVFYSDRTELGYGSKFNLNDSTNRDAEKLYDNMVGVYFNQ